MSNLLNDYKAETPASTRQSINVVLKSIIDAPPLAFDSEARVELIQLILNDLQVANFGGNNKSRLTPSDNAQALLALKMLGKHPAGSRCIALPANLSILIRMSSVKDLEASSEALRCIANAMLLIEGARETFIQTDVGGRNLSIELLEKSNTPDRIFLASRILFLATVSSSAGGPFIRSLVEDKHIHSKTIVDIVAAKLDLLNQTLLSGAKMARDAMTDLLKFVFNLLLHYPKIGESLPIPVKSKGKSNSPPQPQSSDDGSKVMGDIWNHRLDDLLPPLLRIFNTLPPTFPSPMAPPLTHVIHALITIPINDNLRPCWITGSGSSTTRSTRTSTPNGTPPSSSLDALSAAANQEQSTGTSSPTSPNNNRASLAMDRALSVLSAGRRSLSRSPSPLPSANRNSDTLLRGFDLLEVSLSHYIPGSVLPDDMSVRDRVRADSDTTLDDLLSPLVVLITRICLADEGARRRMREWLVPATLDRTSSLEGRADILGRCLRLLSCVYHDRLQTAVGEMLFAMCDCDASSLSAYVGYGNVAGFLFNKGIMSAPPPPMSMYGAGSDVPEDINPITGVINQKDRSVVDEMTEEEKEREAEKLFDLFDRLEKTGALPPNQNPIRKAIADGKVLPR